jgi:hypothetical protein
MRPLLSFEMGTRMERESTAGSLAFKAVFNGPGTCTLQPVVHDTPGDHGRVRVHVVFTNTTETLEALKSAAALGAGVSAEIVLLVPLTVPYPLPLEEPPVSLGFACRRITDLASSISSDADLEAYIYLCRNPLETVLRVLRPHSLVMIGTGKRWFFNKSRRIARKLRAQGHDVIVTSHV